MEQPDAKKRLSWPAPSFFRVRPLMCASLAFMAGIALSRFLPYMVWSWAVAVLCVGAAILLRRRRRGAMALLLFAMVAFGLARGGIALFEPTLPATGKWQVEGTIQGAPTTNERAVMFYLKDVQAKTTDGSEAFAPISGNMYVYYPTTATSTLAHGQRVSVQGTSYLPTGARNPGSFDQRMWMAQSGAHVRLYATAAPKVLAQAGFSVKGLALSISQSLGQRMEALFGEASPVIRAMVLGDQSGMPDQWSDWMRDSGIAHLLAVSGLHVVLWFVLLERMVRPLPVSPRVRWGLLAAILAAYAVITGLRPSVIRAVVMLLAGQGAYLAHRRSDTLTNLSLAALVLLLFRPLDLFGAGFQLSFTAVLGIVLLERPIRRVLHTPEKWPGSALSTTLAAQLGMLPAGAYWFGTVSIIAMLLNLVAIPLVGVLIPIAALGTALDTIWTPLGWLFVQAAQGMVAVLLLMAKISAGIPFAFLRIGAMPWWAAAAFFAAMLLCSDAVVWRLPGRAAAIAAIAIVSAGMAFLSGAFWVSYVQLDVGQALAGVLHVGRKTYVYDTGNTGSDLTEYLMYTGGEVEGLFLSHPHADHIGGFEELLDSGIRVRTVYVPAKADAFGAEEGYAASLARAEAKGANIVELAAGDCLDLGRASMKVIAPEGTITRGNGPNDRSLVLLFEIGNHLLLLTGDADGPAEPLGVDTDVLQVAHHGSRNAARAQFLKDATPDIALISTGRNTYGHPHPETLARLEAADAEIYSTQDSGALILYFMPDSIRVEEYVR